MTQGVLCAECVCGEVGIGGCIEEGQGECGDDNSEAKPEPVLILTDAIHASQPIRAFCVVTTSKETE
jgi:hypothetical protein